MPCVDNDDISVPEISPWRISLLYKLSSRLNREKIDLTLLTNLLEQVMDGIGAERGFIALGYEVDELEFIGAGQFGLHAASAQ
jgi:hypothetical protein